jgi:hypothetical protein
VGVTPRVWAYQLDAVEEAQRDVIDLLGESRDTAIIRLARYQQALWGYLARRVHPPGLLGRRFGSAMDTNQKGKAQTIFTLGRTLCDS